MKNLLIIWAWEWIWKRLTELKDYFDTIYTISRAKEPINNDVTHIVWDVRKEIDMWIIEQKSIDLVVYIPSLRASDSNISEQEFEDYMNVWPKGLLKIFHTLKDNNFLQSGALFTSIGSTASESALNCMNKWWSWIYDLSKLAQKSLMIQLMHCNKDYRFLNLTLWSIGNNNHDWWVGYDNIANTILHIYNTWTDIRYSEVKLLSQLDVI